MKEEPQFWMVWSPQGNPPRFRHDTFDSARDEAKRLARLDPGRTFIVLCAVRGYVLSRPEPEEIRFDDDDLPF